MVSQFEGCVLLWGETCHVLWERLPGGQIIIWLLRDFHKPQLFPQIFCIAHRIAKYVVVSLWS